MRDHIIWTMNGTRLPGDERGWLRKGIPAVQAPDPKLRQTCGNRMKEEMALLGDKQKQVVAETVTSHCRHRSWILLALAVKTNHVHVVVEADREGEDARDQFKAWCSRRLSDQAGLTVAQTKSGGRRRWFTEKGYCRRLEDETYLREAIQYVESQREPPTNAAEQDMET